MGPRTPPSRSGHSETAGRGRRPGERFHYSDLGYQTLGLVIEAVEGRPYPEAVRTRVLEPLRMTATEPAIIHDIRPRLAVGYAYLHDDRIGYPGRPLAPATWVETATADGAIASTAGDIAALARMLLRRGEGPDGRLLSEASFARMAKPHARSMTGYGYGYGLATRVLGGRTFLGHGGGMIGYLSALQVDPAAELAAVILQNGLMGSPMARTRGACQAALTLLPASIVKVSRAEAHARPALGYWQDLRAIEGGTGSREHSRREWLPTWMGEPDSDETASDGTRQTADAGCRSPLVRARSPGPDLARRTRDQRAREVRAHPLSLHARRA